VSPAAAQLTEDTGAGLRRLVRDFIARRVGDTETTEDLTQEVLLKAHRSGVDGNTIDDMAAWLYRIARNTVIDHYRRRSRHPDPDPLPPDPPVANEDERDQRAVRELASCLGPLVADLEPIYREALSLTDLGGLSQAEAARRVGISGSGMKSRVQRARAQLRTAVSNCCAVHTDRAGRISDYDPAPGCRCFA
jgi:RNA polymerase sigma-70 factor, ECF subfamily